MGYSIHKDHPKSCAPDDFWSQVKRTVNGKPVGEDQIGLIVDAILDGLKVEANDTLLDLCCGNGALSDRIFSRCRGGLGVDFSEPLIAVAEKYFQSPPDRVYRLQDVESFLAGSASDELPFTKALCYGAFQYLAEHAAGNVLALLRDRGPRVQRLFIGNLPDREKMSDFLRQRPDADMRVDDPQSAIGIWRTETEFSSLARRSGWHAEFRRMPSQFYAAAYRYDAVLTPIM